MSQIFGLSFPFFFSIFLKHFINFVVTSLVLSFQGYERITSPFWWESWFFIFISWFWWIRSRKPCFASQQRAALCYHLLDLISRVDFVVPSVEGFFRKPNEKNHRSISILLDRWIFSLCVDFASASALSQLALSMFRLVSTRTIAILYYHF